MPELPEVESVRVRLAPYLQGALLAGVGYQPGRVWHTPPEVLAQQGCGKAFGAPARRGKHLILPLGDRNLVIHLGMTGYLGWAQPSCDPRHIHLVLRLQSRGALYFADPRRFGYVWYGSGLPPRLATLAPEITNMNSTGLQSLFADARRPLKLCLLDQDKVSGIGSYIVDEACWRARLHPCLPAAACTAPQWAELTAALHQVIADSLRAGGNSFRDFTLPDGTPGGFAHQLAAYGQLGKACPRCQTPITRVPVGGGRNAYLCPCCQVSAQTDATSIAST